MIEPERRETSIEWLETLPAHWEQRNLGRDVWVRARLGWRGLTVDEYVDTGVPMLSTPDIKGAEINYSGASRITRQRYEESPEIMLAEGDVLLTKDGSTIGTVNVVRRLPEAATVNGSIAVLTPSDAVDGRFLYWYIASQHAQSQFDRLRGGMGVPHLFQRDINRITYPAPPLSEQQAIADYLDRETAQIDTLIEEQRQLIRLIEERRSATVGNAFDVLDAPVSRLKHVARVQTGVTLSGDRYVGEQTWPYLRVANVQAGSLDLREIKEVALPSALAQASLLRTGDVLMTEGGDLDKLGRGTVWRDEVPGAVHQNHVFAVRPRGLSPEFLALWLDAPVARNYFRDTAKKTTNIASTNKWTVGNLPVPKPSSVEQAKLVTTVRGRVGKLDDLIAAAMDFIDISRERRAALITATVTGQIDVGAAA